MTSTADQKKIAVIAGAGPAGLTAALELLRRSNIAPIIFESDNQVGGISKTVEYRGNRMDLGGHRFFSKSDWVMRWWQDILPVSDMQLKAGENLKLTYQGQVTDLHSGPFKSDDPDAVMMVRQRLSRIYYRRQFFDYPLKLNVSTVMNMGLLETLRIGASYTRAKLIRRSPEISLEHFLINRFGDRLYRTFFKDYTEKVWGISCAAISSEWGAQRIKGLSIGKALYHAVTGRLRRPSDTLQKGTETSLIERFLYPKFGPGQMWEEVARQIGLRGGIIHLGHRIVGIERDKFTVSAVHVKDQATSAVTRFTCDHLVSTMPVSELTSMLKPDDRHLVRLADDLPYRDFMTVGLLVKRMKAHKSSQENKNGMPPDNWIYIQEPDVKIGRIQVFNNWSPALVADPETIWLGLEYFCAQNDELWSMCDAEIIEFATKELETIKMIDRADFLDGTVVRVPKAYPAYFGTYSDFGQIRAYLDCFTNLYPVGRNGMHRYNNQDHSMLAANGAVTSIIAGGLGKSDIWKINAETSYHEEIA